MTQTYSDIVQMRAGATPQSFDGNQTVRFNEKARKLVAIKVSHSLSVQTAAEGWAMAIRLQSSNFNGSRYFFAGAFQNINVETNISPGTTMLDIVALDIDIQPNTTLTVDISTVVGSTQTGTHDVTLEFMYADGALPADIMQAIVARSGMPPAKGGSYGYTSALATTVETALTGNNSTLNIPAEAKEIIAVVPIGLLDTAHTQSEEGTGFFKVDYGLSDQGVQKYSVAGWAPGLGTEVDSPAPNCIAQIRSPIYISNLPNRELQVQAWYTAYSAITGGADYALNILWR